MIAPMTPSVSPDGHRGDGTVPAPWALTVISVRDLHIAKHLK
jgi:hypothetical protein